MTRIKLAHRSEHTVILFNDVACKSYGQMSIIVQRYAVIASIEKIHLNSVSNRCIVRDTAGWDMCSSLAVPDNVPLSAKATNWRR